jgi:UDP-N-acetyl-D-mannosaminuronic acid transferase (WecB/TagA/CpsF family)
MSKLSEIKLSVNYEDFLLKLKNFSENKSKGYCCLVNPNILINCYSDKTYFKTLKAAAFNVCDAISIEIINNITKKKKLSLVQARIFLKI